MNIPFIKITKRNIFYPGIIVFSVLLNTLGYTLTMSLGAPFWFNTIGTVYTACLVGPVGGILVTLLTIILCNPVNITLWTYSLCIIPIAVSSNILYRKTSFQDTFQICYAGLLNALLSIAFAIPINYFLFQGHVKNLWGDALFRMLRQTGNNCIFSTIIAQAFIDIPDKILTIFLACILLRLSRFLFARLNRADRNGGAA